MKLSEESRLLIEHWNAVQDILGAEKALRTELGRELLSIGRTLQNDRWWDEAWSFARENEAQVYISRETWKKKDSHVIWIGVEGVTPGNLFGDDSPARCYVWVSGGASNAEVARNLVEGIGKSGDVLGELDKSGANGYVVRKAVPKCLPEELDRFDELVLAPILAFFRHYAAMKEIFDEAMDDEQDTGK